MAQYSIKDLEKLSGIHAHTIRIWEKRYQLVHPQRTTTNIRLYSDIDLKRILNVAHLNKNGLKISKISKLTDQEIANMILQMSGSADNVNNQIESLIVSMIDLDEEKFQILLNELIQKNGFDKTVTSVLYPFLIKIGVLWQTGNVNPAQEHFISNIIRRKLFSAIDSLSAVKTSEDGKFILFLPEGEYHEISLLFYTYLLKKSGKTAIYLGQSVPVSDLISIQKTYNAENLLVSLTTSLPSMDIVDYLTLLSKTFKKSKIYITGTLTQNVDIKKGTNLVKIKNPENFEEMLRKLK